LSFIPRLFPSSGIPPPQFVLLVFLMSPLDCPRTFLPITFFYPARKLISHSFFCFNALNRFPAQFPVPTVLISPSLLDCILFPYASFPFSHRITSCSLGPFRSVSFSQQGRTSIFHPISTGQPHPPPRFFCPFCVSVGIPLFMICSRGHERNRLFLLPFAGLCNGDFRSFFYHHFPRPVFFDCPFLQVFSHPCLPFASRAPFFEKTMVLTTMVFGDSLFRAWRILFIPFLFRITGSVRCFVVLSEGFYFFFLSLHCNVLPCGQPFNTTGFCSFPSVPPLGLRLVPAAPCFSLSWVCGTSARTVPLLSFLLFFHPVFFRSIVGFFFISKVFFPFFLLLTFSEVGTSPPRAAFFRFLLP